VVVTSIEELRQHVRAARDAGFRIGCVPTMGALHDGHVSLMDAARVETGFVVVTIFVNPTQFGPGEDFTRYPRPLEADVARCRDAGVALVFHPDVATIYPRPDATYVDVPGLSTVLEGAFRPDHFRGVATIVLKLLQMVQPDVAFFGQKDFQQQLLIRRMVEDLNVPAEIRTCPTIRDPDGLAMSSRNAYLSETERQTALVLSRALALAAGACRSGQSPRLARELMARELAQTPGMTVDYSTVADADSLQELDSPARRMVALIAARVGTTRLIDNMLIDLD